MPEFIHEYLEHTMSRLGHCSRCMQQSLGAATLLWALFALLSVSSYSGYLQPWVAAIAAMASLVWLAHLAALAIRQAKGLGDDAQLPLPAAGRRRALGHVLRAAGIGVAASLPLSWALPALAFCGQCTKDADCGGSENGWCCKNTAPVNAGYVCNECKEC